ncbi:LiaF transmembrane domain-containing protein [Carboxylicivirga sp. N1Y90]|uniref:LiaF transmembrane domain-containing protein n=1 Tax=Carboxylicivirga fragile TaxID=3417571 RepID=UPI003D349241|nr:hypothetical protein [Marinilabiliaceae bacterium N1Y90]
MTELKRNNRAIIGLFIILAGSILLMGTMDLLPSNIYYILFSWPMILVAIGVINLIKKEYVPALIMMAVGFFFLSPRLFEEIHYGDLFRYWPVLVILAGVQFIFRKKKPFTSTHHLGDDADTIDEVDIFGGGVTQVESQNFKGGKITAIFGGGEISMERCQLSEQGAVLDLAVIFGGTKIIVPRDWNVRTEMVSIFGGFADKRNYFSENNSDPSKTLTIKGVAIFGGGELKNF